MHSRPGRRLTPLLLTLVVVAAVIAGCGGAPTATQLASSTSCGPYTNPFPAPPGDNAFNQRMNLLLSRMKGVCVTVDGSPISDADLAFSIIAGHDNSAEAVKYLSSAYQSHPRLLPISDEAYLRAAIANRVLERLLLDKANAEHFDVNEASWLRVSKMRHRLISNVAPAVGQARLTTWFRDNLSRHKITIIGVHLAVESLPNHLRDGLIAI